MGGQEAIAGEILLPRFVGIEPISLADFILELANKVELIFRSTLLSF
jgi:hypothetical protein